MTQTGSITRELVTVAFIAPDHNFTPRQREQYTNQAHSLLQELFQAPESTTAPAKAKPATASTPSASPATDDVPIVVAVAVHPTAITEPLLRRLGAWATQVSIETRLPELGLVIGDYYYPYKSTESTLS